MRGYHLTPDEQKIVKKFQNYSIPFIFKAGDYLEYLQYFELIQIEVCYILIKNKKISKELYNMVLEVIPIDFKIQEDKLDANANDFYKCYLEIEKLIKKYY